METHFTQHPIMWSQNSVLVLQMITKRSAYNAGPQASLYFLLFSGTMTAPWTGTNALFHTAPPLILNITLPTPITP